MRFLIPKERSLQQLFSPLMTPIPCYVYFTCSALLRLLSFIDRSAWSSSKTNRAGKHLPRFLLGFKAAFSFQVAPEDAFSLRAPKKTQPTDHRTTLGTPRRSQRKRAHGAAASCETRGRGALEAPKPQEMSGKAEGLTPCSCPRGTACCHLHPHHAAGSTQRGEDTRGEPQTQELI